MSLKLVSSKIHVQDSMTYLSYILQQVLQHQWQTVVWPWYMWRVSSWDGVVALPFPEQNTSACELGPLWCWCFEQLWRYKWRRRFWYYQSEETHEEGNLEIPQRNAQLTLSHLASLRAASSSTTEADQHKHYAENGVKKSRIKAVLSSKAQSGCQCDKKCLVWWLYGTFFQFFMILQRANSWPLKMTPNDCKKSPSQVLAAGLCCIAAPDLRILLEFEQACSRRAPVVDSVSQWSTGNWRWPFWFWLRFIWWFVKQ